MLGGASKCGIYLIFPRALFGTAYKVHVFTCHMNSFTLVLQFAGLLISSTQTHLKRYKEQSLFFILDVFADQFHITVAQIFLCTVVTNTCGKSLVWCAGVAAGGCCDLVRSQIVQGLPASSSYSQS